MLLSIRSAKKMNIQSNKFLRAFWLGLGLLLSMIGLIGIVVPGLPTTPIMILAAACFFKSSEKLYDWVLQNKYFGEHVKNFREGRCMPLKAKVTAIITMWIFVSISIFIGIPDTMILAKVLTFFGAATGTFYVISLRTI
jgi:hypothetical protein|tara:strand:- start:99 stop:515 length:417 start_codon:yes stop_codon:yes gene_type:complete